MENKQMRKGLWIACCIGMAAVVSGCSASEKKGEKIVSQAQKQKEVKNKVFPQVMVGVWEAKGGENDWEKWGIKLEPDGSIKRIVHPVVGPVKLEEGGAYKEGEDPNDYMMVQMGPCKASYDPTTKRLDVSIVVDYYRMVLPSGVLEGKLRDEFSGPISQDGKTWKVKWWDYGWLEGAGAPDVNAIKANPEHLIFYKIDLTSEPNGNK
jgi:hypothetical protein